MFLSVTSDLQMVTDLGRTVKANQKLLGSELYVNLTIFENEREDRLIVASRISNEDELFFPVDTRPIYTRLNDSESETQIAIPNRVAVLNCRSGDVLGVVGKDYRLVSNLEAAAYARQCARAVFQNTVEDEWEIFAVDAPSSAIYCHIDLRHRTGALDFGYVMVGTREEIPDSYGPYIRVTNSYNAQRALKFTIGCYRKVCENGMMAPGDIISFSFAHTRDNIQSEIDFIVDHDRVRKMQQEFQDAFDRLRRYEFARELGKVLVQVILAIRMPKNAKVENPDNYNAFQRDWYRLDGYIDSLFSKYADRLGNNAYSTLQAATELASNPIENLCLRKDKNTLQRLAGEWMADFQKKTEERSFDLAEYLESPVHDHETLVTSRRRSAHAQLHF